MNNESQHPPDDSEEHRQLLDKEWDDLLARNLSNTENLDKAILSLSSAGLGVSLVFVVRNLERLASAHGKYILYLSWMMFIFAIISTLVSYLTSLHGIDKEFARLSREYDQENEEELGNTRNLPAKMTKVLRYVSVIGYVSGVSLTFLFIAFNQILNEVLP